VAAYDQTGNAQQRIRAYSSHGTRAAELHTHTRAWLRRLSCLCQESEARTARGALRARTAASISTSIAGW
jgi:hypothetical protein